MPASDQGVDGRVAYGESASAARCRLCQFLIVKEGPRHTTTAKQELLKHLEKEHGRRDTCIAMEKVSC